MMKVTFDNTTIKWGEYVTNNEGDLAETLNLWETGNIVIN